MLNLNLLPPAVKRDISYLLAARAVVAVGGGIGAAAVIFFVFLSPTFFSLVFQKAEAVRALATEVEAQTRAGIAAAAEDIGSLDRVAERVIGHERERLATASLFTTLLQEVPPAVRLTSIGFRAEPREFTVHGFAPARADFLKFRRNLEASPEVTRVSSPLANLIRETDIAFSLVIAVK